MSIKQITLIQAAVTFVKGDRVIVNYGTAREPEYYAGTIMAIRTGKAKVLFDDGSEEVYLIPVRPAKVGILGKTLVKRKRSTMIPKEQVEKWLMVEEPVKIPKAPVKKAPKDSITPTKTNDEIQPTKPAAVTKPVTPKPPPPPVATEERKANWWVKEQYEFVVNRITPQDYDDCPVLGAILNTGRQGPTGSGAIIGVDKFKNQLSWVVRTDHKDLRLKFVFMPFPTSVSLFTTFESMNQKARDRGAKRVSFQTLISQYRPEYAAYKKMMGEKQGQNEEQNEQKAKQFDFANSVGKQAEIQWSNGFPTWKTIVAVDMYKEAVAIRGSGTKNRWIPFRLVSNIKD